MQFDPVSCQCSCPWGAGQNSNGECECSAPTKDVGGACQCPSAAELCSIDGQVVVNRSCDCVCPAGKKVDTSGTKCVCDRGCYPNQVQDPDTCECSCKACPAGQVSNPATCECACPNGTDWDPATQQCACNLSCPVGSVRAAAPACSCECEANLCPNWEDGIFMGCDDCGE